MLGGEKGGGGLGGAGEAGWWGIRSSSHWRPGEPVTPQGRVHVCCGAEVPARAQEAQGTVPREGFSRRGCQEVSRTRKLKIQTREGRKGLRVQSLHVDRVHITKAIWTHASVIWRGFPSCACPGRRQDPARLCGPQGRMGISTGNGVTAGSCGLKCAPSLLPHPISMGQRKQSLLTRVALTATKLSGTLVCGVSQRELPVVTG